MTSIAALCIAIVVIALLAQLRRFHRADTIIVHESPRELNQTLYSVLRGRRRW